MWSSSIRRRAACRRAAGSLDKITADLAADGRSDLTASQ
jgi:hypothetical protein